MSTDPEYETSAIHIQIFLAEVITSLYLLFMIGWWKKGSEPAVLPSLIRFFMGYDSSSSSTPSEWLQYK